MKTVVQVEFSESLLTERLATLRGAGFCAAGVLLRPGKSVPLPLDAVIVIGHRAPVEQRQKLISQARQESPRRSIIALLGRSDLFLSDVDENCPADNPVAWLRTVRRFADEMN
jgi:hypothetical protein